MDTERNAGDSRKSASSHLDPIYFEAVCSSCESYTQAARATQRHTKDGGIYEVCYFEPCATLLSFLIAGTLFLFNTMFHEEKAWH